MTNIKPNKPPAFMFYADEWLSSWAVKRMTTSQRGMYIQMLAAAWTNEPICTLPNDDKELWRLAGAKNKQDWDRQKELILKQWVLDEETNTWSNLRLMKERLGQIKRSEHAKDAVELRYKGKRTDTKQNGKPANLKRTSSGEPAWELTNPPTGRQNISSENSLSFSSLITTTTAAKAAENQQQQPGELDYQGDKQPPESTFPLSPKKTKPVETPTVPKTPTKPRAKVDEFDPLTFNEDIDGEKYSYPAAEVRRILDWHFKQNPDDYWRGPKGKITSKRRLANAIDTMNEDVPRRKAQVTQKKFYSAVDIDREVQRLFKALPVCSTCKGTNSVKGKFVDDADCPDCRARKQKLIEEVTEAR